MIVETRPIFPPGARFLYSDINFETLGFIVERVSGMPLNDYAAQNIFTPLGMKETRFDPPAAWLPRIAPTEYDEHGRMLRGIVHDPTARHMGGVAGHAGLFSTADDVARYAQICSSGLQGAEPARGREDDHAAATAQCDRGARSRLGHRFALLQQSRRIAPRRFVRSYRIHRHIALDRSRHRTPTSSS